jgi:hypothetical protein
MLAADDGNRSHPCKAERLVRPHASQEFRRGSLIPLEILVYACRACCVIVQRALDLLAGEIRIRRQDLGEIARFAMDCDEYPYRDAGATNHRVAATHARCFTYVRMLFHLGSPVTDYEQLPTDQVTNGPSQ